MTNYLPTRFAQELIARVRGTIAQHNVSQSDLASLCDVSQSQFSKIIRGTRPITVDQLAAICVALDIDIAELIGEVDAFIGPRNHSVPTPIRYVRDGERIDAEEVEDDERDAWAQAAAKRFQLSEGGGTVVPLRRNVPAPVHHERAVAKKKSRDPGGDEGGF